MKKIVSFLLIACLAAMCFATTSLAATGAAVVVGDKATAAQGDTVTFTVSLDGENALGCYGAALAYDNTAFKLVDMKKGDFCASVNKNNGKATGFADENVTEGTLFTATFEVLAAKGEYTIDVAFDADSTATAAQEPVEMAVKAATIKVVCDHTFDDGKVTKEATCTEAGEKVFTCTKCGETDTKAIAALGHDWKVEVTKEATCEEAGEEVHTCARCQISETKVIAALGHDWEWVIDKEATVDAEGEKHEECANCGAKQNEGTKIAKLEKPVDNVAPTGDATNVAVAGALCLAAAAAAFVLTKKRG